LLVGFFITRLRISLVNRTRQTIHTSHVLFYEIEIFFNENFNREALDKRTVLPPPNAGLTRAASRTDGRETLVSMGGQTLLPPG
jgi:hypothetical protein